MTKRYILPEAKEFAKRFGGISTHGNVYDVPGAPLGIINVDDYNAIREATAVEDESERLVGKARGEDRGVSFAAALRMMDAVFGPRRGETWVDVGGGEEKPVREAQQPATDRPRCGTCQFSAALEGGTTWLRCRRYPPKVNDEGGRDEVDVSPNNWCGEWRAK